VKHSKYTYKNFISEVQDLGSWLVTLKFPSDISEMKSVFQMTGNLYTVELYGFRAKNSKRWNTNHYNSDSNGVQRCTWIVLQ